MEFLLFLDRQNPLILQNVAFRHAAALIITFLCKVALSFLSAYHHLLPRTYLLLTHSHSHSDADMSRHFLTLKVLKTQKRFYARFLSSEVVIPVMCKVESQGSSLKA